MRMAIRLLSLKKQRRKALLQQHLLVKAMAVAHVPQPVDFFTIPDLTYTLA